MADRIDDFTDKRPFTADSIFGFETLNDLYAMIFKLRAALTGLSGDAVYGGALGAVFPWMPRAIGTYVRDGVTSNYTFSALEDPWEIMPPAINFPSSDATITFQHTLPRVPHIQITPSVSNDFVPLLVGFAVRTDAGFDISFRTHAGGVDLPTEFDVCVYF